MARCGAEQSFECARLFPLHRERVPKAGEGCSGRLAAYLPLLDVPDDSLLVDASIKTPLTDTSDDSLQYRAQTKGPPEGGPNRRWRRTLRGARLVKVSQKDLETARVTLVSQ